MLRFRSRVLRLRVLASSFSSFGCFVFEIWGLRFRDLGASCFGLRFRVLRFRNYPPRTGVYDQMEQLFTHRKFHFCYHRNFRVFFLNGKRPLGTNSHRTISKNSSGCRLLIGHKKCFVLLCPIGEQFLLSSFREFVHDGYCLATLARFVHQACACKENFYFLLS